MRVFTDGETHLVLGPGGLAVHRSGTDPQLIAVGPAAKRGAVASPPRNVLAPLDEELTRVLVTVERTAYEVSLEDGTSRKLTDRILDAVRGHDGRLFAVTAGGTGSEQEAQLMITTLEPGGVLVAGDTLKLPPPVRIEWPKATIWEEGVDPWPEADEDFDAAEHKLDAIAVGYSSRDGTTFFDAVHLATSAHGVALASAYSGVIAVVRPGAREVAFAVRVPATRDAQEIFAVPTKEGVLVVTTMHGKNSAVLHIAPGGKVLAHVSRFADGLAFGLGAPFLVDDSRAVLVQSLKGGKVTALELPGLEADVLGDLDMKLAGESSAFTTKDGRASIIGLGDMAYLFRISDEAEVEITPILMPAAPVAPKRVAAPIPTGPGRMTGPPALALSKATAGAGEWNASRETTTTVDVAFSSAGGKGKGIYVEVGGPAFASGLVVAETVSIGKGDAKIEAKFAVRGAASRAELPEVVLEPAYAIEEPRRRTTRPEPPPPMPVMIVRVGVRGAKPGANLLTIRVGPLGADPGRGSALQGKRIVTT